MWLTCPRAPNPNPYAHAHPSTVPVALRSMRLSWRKLRLVGTRASVRTYATLFLSPHHATNNQTLPLSLLVLPENVLPVPCRRLSHCHPTLVRFGRLSSGCASGWVCVMWACADGPYEEGGTSKFLGHVWKLCDLPCSRVCPLCSTFVRTRHHTSCIIIRRRAPSLQMR
jgi:hypothetical protein